MGCPVCGKEFREYTGRRPKKFCSDRCKIIFWNKQKTSTKVTEPAKESEIKETKQEDNSVTQKIKELQNEINGLGSGSVAEMRRRYLEKQIYNLRSKN